MSALPEFPYHPDPVATGSVEPSTAECIVCGQARGHVYTGPVYAEDEHEGICPWCIADGSAAEQLDAEFTDVGDFPDGVPSEVVDAVARRTPGFSGWQQEHWLYHCDDGAAFLGRAGYDDVRDKPDALEALRQDEIPPEALEALDREGETTAYLFRCRHCGTHLAYWDCA
jgi:hypothetical protein